MARIVAGSAPDYATLGFEDGKMYDLTLVSLEPYTEGEYGPATMFEFTVGGFPKDVTLRVFAGNAIGQMKSGTPSKLRQLIAAFGGIPSSVAPAGWDDETFEADYPDGQIVRIKVGEKIRGRGEFVPGPDGDVYRLTRWTPAAASGVPTGHEVTQTVPASASEAIGSGALEAAPF